MTSSDRNDSGRSPLRDLDVTGASSVRGGADDDDIVILWPEYNPLTSVNKQAKKLQH